MGVPLQSDDLTSLLAIYDKKGEGVMNYDDYISEQKYIHAVSLILCIHVCIYMCNICMLYAHVYYYMRVYFPLLHSNIKLVQMMISKQRRYDQHKRH